MCVEECRWSEKNQTKHSFKITLKRPTLCTEQTSNICVQMHSSSPLRKNQIEKETNRKTECSRQRESNSMRTKSILVVQSKGRNIIVELQTKQNQNIRCIAKERPRGNQLWWKNFSCECVCSVHTIETHLWGLQWIAICVHSREKMRQKLFEMLNRIHCCFFFAVGVLPLESVLLVSVRFFFNVSLSSNAGNNKHWYRAFRRQSSLRWTSIYIRIQAISHTVLLLKIYIIFFRVRWTFSPLLILPFCKIHYFQFDFAIFTWCSQHLSRTHFKGAVMTREQASGIHSIKYPRIIPPCTEYICKFMK